MTQLEKKSLEHVSDILENINPCTRVNGIVNKALELGLKEESKQELWKATWDALYEIQKALKEAEDWTSVLLKEK